MITIYHNPRCRKSREGLQALEASGLAHKVRLYLNDPLTAAELTQLLGQRGITAEALIRKGEAIWKSDYKGKSLSEKELIAAMVAHPKLIERPILSDGQKAVVGRPAEAVQNFLQNIIQH